MLRVAEWLGINPLDLVMFPLLFAFFGVPPIIMIVAAGVILRRPDAAPKPSTFSTAMAWLALAMNCVLVPVPWMLMALNIVNPNQHVIDPSREALLAGAAACAVSALCAAFSPQRVRMLLVLAAMMAAFLWYSGATAAFL